MSWDSYGGLPPGANFDPSFLPQNSYGAQFYAPAHSADQDEEQYYDPTSPDSETELASTWNAHHPANTFSPSNNTAGPSNTTGITNNPVDKAAILRAELLKRRESSRGPANLDKQKPEPLEVGNLIKEYREAAEKSQSNIKTENIQHHKDNTNDILHTTYTPNAGNTVKKTAKVADTSPNMLTMTEQPKGGDLASSNMTVVSQSSSATLGAERPGQNEPMLNENSGSDVWPPSNSKTKLADQKTTKHSTKTTIATPNSGPSDQEQQDEQMDNDLEHWLELTGYHNIANRKRLLTIHRRRKQLARELAELDREVASGVPVGIAVPSAEALVGSPVVPVARAVTVSSALPTPTETAPPKPTAVKHETKKRPHSPEPQAGAGKLARKVSPVPAPKAPKNSYKTDSPDAPRRPAFQPAPRRSPSPRYDSFRGRGREPYRRSPSPGGRAYGRFAPHSPERERFDYGRGRGRGRGRGGSLRGGGGRDVSPVPFNSLHDDARYFIIKSWNHENVDIAMREGSWVTQAANEGMFADAYRNSRNVILFFSVNKSATFQGYARMDSAPGAATPPSWVNELRWPASAPFKVHWIRKRDTHFSKVGHLKNAFNDDQPVLVGRDGQEVEESCGRALCEIIDEESRW